MGRYLPRRTAAREIQLAFADLGTRGSCLSRCLAVAARAPSAQVILGVRRDGAVAAHAWLDVDGAPLDPGHTEWREIARLPPSRGSG